MRIISGEIIQESEHDGVKYVTERHHYDNETSNLLSDQYPAHLNATEVMAARIERINAEHQKADEVSEAALDFEIPLSDVEIMRRITPEEWDAFQSSTNENIMYFRDVFAKTPVIYRNDPLTQAGFGMLVTAGILTQARVDEILR